jgi:hypothetical protein
LAHTDERPSGGALRDLRNNSRARTAAIVVVGVLVGLVIWFVVAWVRDDGSPGTPPTAETSGPTLVSANGLATLIKAGDQPVFWVGERLGMKYELSEIVDQAAYVRYLPTGVRVGDKRQFLTIGTYPLANAYDVTAGTRKQGAQIFNVPGGGVAAVSKNSPKSVYVAFPGVDYQVEIYDPHSTAARKLATSGAVQRVPAPAEVSEARGPEKATINDLRGLARSLRHPIYWAGPQPGKTYELAKSEDGAVYIRYLPKGMKVGSERGVTTVVTYPVRNGFAVTQEGGKVKGMFTRKLDGGGVAIYAQDNPHNVYLGFPGEDVQVEVYSPAAVAPLSLVVRGKIVPVG